MTDIMCTYQIAYKEHNYEIRIMIHLLGITYIPFLYSNNSLNSNLSTSTSALSKLIKKHRIQFPVNIPSITSACEVSLDYHKTKILVQLEFGWSLRINQKVLYFVQARGIYNSIGSCHKLHACGLSLDYSQPQCWDS